MYTGNKFLRKSAGIGDVLNGVVKGGTLTNKLLFTSALTTGVLAALGISKAMSPEAVADNADNYVYNEAVKSSLLKSMRDRDRLTKKLEAMNGNNNKRLPHDMVL